MQLMSKFNKETRFLVCVIDIFSKYAWVFALHEITIANAFQKVLNRSEHELSKIWVDKGSKL